MLLEQYVIVIRVCTKTGKTEYFDGIEFGNTLFNPDDETNGPAVRLFTDHRDAMEVVKAWEHEDPPGPSARHRYEAKKLRFGLDVL